MKKGWLFIFIIWLCLSCGPDTDLINILKPNTQIELLFPENMSECLEGVVLSETESEVTFRWADERDDRAYKLHLKDLLSTNTIILDSNTKSLPIVLKRGNPYSWFVTIQNGSQSSEVWYFYNAGAGKESSIPFPAQAVSPSNGSAISATSTTVNLSWNAVDLDDDILNFDLYFGTEENPEVLRTEIEGTRANGIPVETGIRYYWKIVTRDKIGNESTSAIFSFTVG